MPKLLPVANLLLDNLAQVSQAEQNAVSAEVSNANDQANLNLWMLAIIGVAGAHPGGRRARELPAFCCRAARVASKRR